MIAKLGGVYLIKSVAVRAFVLFVVFFGLIGFTMIAPVWLFHFLYFIHLDIIVNIIRIPLWFLQWPFIIVGFIWFYKKTKL